MPYVGRNVQPLVAVDLPLPPPIGRAFAPSQRGFLRKTGDYRFWMNGVKDEHGEGENLPVLPRGSYGLFIELPRRMLGDTDNRVKLIADIMRPVGDNAQRRAGLSVKDYPGLAVTDDDKFMDAHYVQRADHVPEGRCHVTAVTIDRWRGYVCMRLSD